MRLHEDTFIGTFYIVYSHLLLGSVGPQFVGISDNYRIIKPSMYYVKGSL